MILSERPNQFYDRLRIRQVEKVECIEVVESCLKEERYLEAIYIIDTALTKFGSSKYFNKKIIDVIDAMMKDITIVDDIFERYPDIGADVFDIYQKVRKKFLPIHGISSSTLKDDAFLNCVIFKVMCMVLDKNQPVWTVLLRLSEYFGRLSANALFGRPTNSSTINGGIAKIVIGGRVLRYHVSNAFLDFGLRYFFINEPGLLRLISSFHQEDVFLDIGANIGGFSIVAALTKGCRTFAIEPFSVNYAELLKNISLNNVGNRVTPLRVAISDATGEGPLSIRSEFAGAASQTFGGGAENAILKAGRAEWLQGYRLDDLIAEGTIDFPTHIKIDVDGTEHRIIAGMPETLKDPRLRSIRLEIRVEDPENAEALRNIEAAGFSWKIDDDQKNLLCLRD